MRLVKLLAISLVSGALVLANAPETPAAYPDKPITIIVPFGAGGAYGRLGRKMGRGPREEARRTRGGQEQPGRGWTQGARVVLFKSKPDGYTIGFVHFVSFQSNEILRGKKASIDYNKFKIILKLTDAKQFVFVNKKIAHQEPGGLQESRASHQVRHHPESAPSPGSRPMPWAPRWGSR